MRWLQFINSKLKINGARGGSRTPMRKNPRRILSPQRLPFRHPGIVEMAGISIRNSREFDHLRTAMGENEKTPGVGPRMCSEARIMLLIKEILPDARQRNMLLPL